MASVRVAVRIRPFNGREKEMNAVVCLKMEGSQTIIYHPETKEPKIFNFDFSYWSHDGFEEGPNGELIALSKQYATQQMVFNDLGQDVLSSAYDGYNSTLFAYGQTGAGKSFSMVGYGPNKGIVPIVCDEMFKTVVKAVTDNNGKRYQITVTMLEIYNECIRDLLNPSVNCPGGLKVRSKPGVGVYVEKLTPVAVSSFQEIEKRMEEGTANRTIGSTKMNATSSRAHTVFGINFSVFQTYEGQESEMSAHMNLVDLAGSERADSTGATGDRLKEGCAINASLSALGNVISALADIAMGKKKVFVPYRNSALTRLLQDALGGNSRTIMIAALSPADVNYDETLSTLRYADRAKKIKNNVVKNENPTDKIIRLLKEENSRLMALLSGKGISVPTGGGDGESGGSGSADPAALEEMKNKLQEENKAKLEEQMKENDRIINEMKKSWEQKLAESSKLQTNSMADSGAVSAKASVGTNLPHIINLHEDPQLSECLLYMFKKGLTRIGRGNTEIKQDITFSGLSILAEHALVKYSDDGIVKIECINKSKTFVNGELVSANGTVLHSGDRVIFGNNFVFRFINPNEPLTEEQKNSYRIELAHAEAMEEFSTKQGLRLSQSLGGEMGKLEQEEASKRKELEDKLAKMEESMRRERELARSALEQQKSMFLGKMKNGGDLSADEKAQLAQFEDAYNNKARNLEEEIVKRREISEKIMQEQMKRKRQTKKIEERLAKLMPSINEANSMADELQKPVRFEARLAVKSTSVNLSALDELRNLKTIDITVRVTSTENGNIWTWNHAKFDSRLYMMREIYQEYMDFGPRQIQKSKDPFWDPPEAVEIGKAYVYLKALSQLVEIENEFAIVDYKGDEQGQLEVNIFPEGINGEDLDYLNDSSELIGKSVTFRVAIPNAKNLPAKYNNDVYCAFSFNGETKETEACELKTSDPKWKFEARFKIENMTEEVRQYLLKDAAVFEVKGFSDTNSAEQKEAQAAAKAAHLLANSPHSPNSPHQTQSQANHIAGPHSTICAQCEEHEAAFECTDCQRDLCNNCFTLLHKSAKKAGHNKVPLNAAAAGASTTVQCSQCEEKDAIIQCHDCEKTLCEACNILLHKSAKKAEHNRKPLTAESAAAINLAKETAAKDALSPHHDEPIDSNANSPVATAGTAAAPAPAAGSKPKCDQCDEQPSIVNCSDCSKNLCTGCNALLHKSAKKDSHNRVNL